MSKKETPADDKTPEQKAIESALKGLKLREIGPAFMGGRIADIAIHPIKKSTWYLAVGSGGVWKTTNAGTTWKPIFDDQPSYSIGCVTLDPNNPDTVWVGTGESVSGRHVGWGSGVYRSRNGGASWECVGLEKSEHIGKILVDPRDGNTVLVAAEGPLWASGGDRGIYKTTDGGETWTAVFQIDDDTGFTDIAFEPTNPDIVYAAAYQRRRHVWAFMGGGKEGSIYKSTDNGDNWRKITQGLPKGHVGKIGLAVTPADPAIVYATVEAKEDEKGFYRSVDRGESWEKRNKYISDGTGPHYYQEIYASPHDANRVYQMDVFVNRTTDGGKTFNVMETGAEKHSDNHVLWIDPADGDHLLLGTDAGLYESFDEGGKWRHFPNLPISQFYRVAINNSEPFYNILGGAQDLGTLFGPSRTTNQEGVRNKDWYVPTGADGYHVAFDPEDPSICYMEFQNGFVFRYDRRSNEVLDIQPQPEPGEPPNRWNWDTPIVISPHNNKRLYVASQRVWRSEDRGNSWTAVSPDLSRNQNRYEMEINGRVWSVDDLYDSRAMSLYGNISTFTESPLVEGLLYAGTDDGLIQVSEDGGDNWRKAAELPAVPDLSFIQCVSASPLDADTVFAVADAHKLGDFSPYIFISTDRGKSWESISGNMPDTTIGWAIHQDRLNENLLFLAAEYGLYVSFNKGQEWHKLQGAPTIAFRDLKLHQRDDDLVGASFGRGFYVLDDFTPLRDIADGALANDAHLFPVRDAWWYVPYRPMQGNGQPTLGSTYYTAKNPPFGAVISYFLKESHLTAKDARHKAEKELDKDGKSIPYPGSDALYAEIGESEPQILLTISDANGNIVRRLTAPAKEGLHRIAWDLRTSPPDPIKLKKEEFMSPWASPPAGALVAPGEYGVELSIVTKDGVQPYGEKQSFTVKAVPTMRDGVEITAVTTHQENAADLMRRVAALSKEMDTVEKRLKFLRAALAETPAADLSLYADHDALVEQLKTLRQQLSGDPVRQKLHEADSPSLQGRAFRAFWGHRNTRQMPTATQQRSLELADAAYSELLTGFSQLVESDIAAFETALNDAGAPWTPGRV